MLAVLTSDRAVAAIIFLTAFLAFFRSTVHPLGDSHYSLLLSEHLLTRGTFALDEHFKLPLDPRRYPGINGTRGPYPYQIDTVEGHQYYYALGSPVLSIPFVAAFRAFGLSTMARDGSYDLKGEIRMERGLASFLMAVLAVLFYAIARLLLPMTWSVVSALVGALGTQVWSTAALALWSDTWGILLLGVVVWMLLAHEVLGRPLRGAVLATLVAWMYIVRPTYALVVGGVGAYVFVRDRRSWWRYLVTGGGWLAALALYSWIHYHRPLPTFYGERFLTFERFWKPLAAHVVSPNRGLLVYVPVVAFVLWLLIRYAGALRHRGLLALAGLVIAAHLVVISGAVQWHAGMAYGPRYTTGIVPWLFVVAVLGVRAMLDCGRPSRGTLAAGTVLAALSIVIQYRGAHVLATWQWNLQPPIETHADERVWDWRSPQIAARATATRVE
jgi:hypothetical protein